MNQEFVFVKDNIYKKAKKSGGFLYYEKSSCKNCNKEYFKRKQKNNPYCSRRCYREDGGSNFEQKFSFESESVINGSLISDGCITKYPKSKHYYYTHSCKYKEYIEFLESSLNIKCNKYPYTNKSPTGKTCKGFVLKTPVSKTYSELRKKWYPNGEKIIPENIEFNSLMLLHWYLGDGNYCSESGVTLCTDGFDKKSLELARSELKKIGFDNYFNKRKRIIIPNKYVYEFINYIGDCPIMCYEHKWNIIPKESYKNRICKFCNSQFDAKINSQQFCKPKCYKNNWYLKNKIA